MKRSFFTQAKTRKLLAYLFPVQPGVPDYLRSNIRHLIWDIGWWGLLNGTTLSFMTIYAARIGANISQIGLLTAMPAAINLLLALPAGSWLTTRPIDKSVFWSAVLQRSFYFLMILLPWLMSDILQVWMLILFTLLMSIPGSAIAVGFNALFAAAIPVRYRGVVAGRRNAVFAITSIISTIGCGQILTILPFPLNYQVVFAIGFIGALMSAVHLKFVTPVADKYNSEIETPTIAFKDIERKTKGFLNKIWFEIGRKLHFEILQGAFARSIGLLTFFHMAHYLAIPIFPVFTVNVLGLSDSVLSLGNAFFYVTMFFGSTQVGKLTYLLGNKKLTGIGICMLGLYPAFLSFAEGAFLYYLASFLGGFAWSLVNAAMINYLLEKVPPSERTRYLAWFILGANAAILIGTLVGPIIGNTIGLSVALLLFAILRTTSGLALLKWG
ncbi:MAG: MFS transporter [Anaerolineaceae bacterium]|nr:MFS transporter [Anaerolineaceae bacterium]